MRASTPQLLYRSIAIALLLAVFTVQVLLPKKASAQFFGGWTYVLKLFHLPNQETLVEKALVYVLDKEFGTSLPIALNANNALPVIPNDQLPGGGRFHPKPFVLTRENFFKDLPVGDTEVTATGWCNQASVHQPSRDYPYVIANVEGTQAESDSTLLFRGTWFGVNPDQLQDASWAIQSGMTYGNMPKRDQVLIDKLIPDFKSRLNGNIIDQIQAKYKMLASDPRPAIQQYGKEFVHVTVPLMMIPKITVPLPPLDRVLGGVGPKGHTALDAYNLQQSLRAKYEAEERGQQVPVGPGDGERVQSPIKAEDGPWTVRIPGRVYERVIIKSGNKSGDNLLQIRVLPPQSAAADPDKGPHLVEAAYQMGPGATASGGLSLFALEGGIGDPAAIQAFVAQYGSAAYGSGALKGAGALEGAGSLLEVPVLPAVALGLTIRAIVGYPQGANAQALDIMVSGWINSMLPQPTVSTGNSSASTTQTAPKSKYQTCENNVRDQLEADMHKSCDNLPGMSCGSSVSDKRKAKYTCSAILARIAATQECLDKRKNIQDVCYSNAPLSDPETKTHWDVIDQTQRGLQACLALAAINCAPAHPMANQ